VAIGWAGPNVAEGGSYCGYGFGDPNAKVILAGSAVTVTPSAGSNAAGTALTGASVQSAMGANTAVIDCGSYGTATFSGSDFASPFKTHAATSAFGEFIYRKAVGSDAHLCR
jgi:hypothetical protein